MAESPKAIAPLRPTVRPWAHIGRFVLLGGEMTGPSTYPRPGNGPPLMARRERHPLEDLRFRYHRQREVIAGAQIQAAESPENLGAIHFDRCMARVGGELSGDDLHQTIGFVAKHGAFYDYLNARWLD